MDILQGDYQGDMNLDGPIDFQDTWNKETIGSDSKLPDHHNKGQDLKDVLPVGFKRLSRKYKL